MGTSGDDAGCPARDHIDGDNGRLKSTRGEAFGLAERISRYQVSPPVHFEERA
jgi:hypothetical protein